MLNFVGAIYYFLGCGLISYLSIENQAHRGPFVIGCVLLIAIGFYILGLNETINMICKPFMHSPNESE